jgi:glycosyltransferase involved in cell wall biosynthesis
MTAPPGELGGTRIGVVNWRDPWHPQAGGAERYAWEMARGLTARGATVTYLTARAPGQARRERRDGIGIVRLGGRFTVYPLVLGWLLLHRLPPPLKHGLPRGQLFDAVLDCQNGIPFFTPCALPRRVPVLCVVHHVHTSQFAVHFPGWLARVGQLLEGPTARAVYRRHACVGVSASTVAAMRVRLRWRGVIHIVPNGAVVPSSLPAPPEARQAGHARLVWVGRLVAHKRPELVLPVAERLGAAATIDMIGRGPGEPLLAAAIERRGLSGRVRLRGFLPEADKDAIVTGSVLHLNTSQGEGWGLCVIEAAALGVPTVAYDVEGLRDAVRDGTTGWLVRDGELLEDVVERALKELGDPDRRAAVAAACRAWAGQFSWDSSAAKMAELILAALNHRP